ncbi:hypothetical protein [Microvirga vignae]|uniref:hypothetical protein n=1 Tax=Microvirga vignae TaxID=1225564 RepID=UPI000B1EFC87|nr:hypothetical protein [Microvirga vignae]
MLDKSVSFDCTIRPPRKERQNAGTLTLVRMAVAPFQADPRLRHIEIKPDLTNTGA